MKHYIKWEKTPVINDHRLEDSWIGFFGLIKYEIELDMNFDLNTTFPEAIYTLKCPTICYTDIEQYSTIEDAKEMADKHLKQFIINMKEEIEELLGE